MEVDKKKFIDKMGRPFTQGLFLEIGYTEFAVYTLKEVDWEYEGKLYPSLKRLYLECSDPTEYEFSSKYLLNWNHWQRLCENKIIRRHIEEWRAELEVKLRSEGVRMAMQAAKAGAFQAARWVANGDWKVRGAGRPSKAEIERERQVQSKIHNEFQDDMERMGGLRVISK